MINKYKELFPKHRFDTADKSSEIPRQTKVTSDINISLDELSPEGKALIEKLRNQSFSK